VTGGCRQLGMVSVLDFACWMIVPVLCFRCLLVGCGIADPPRRPM
jgi:hypothetical protein